MLKRLCIVIGVGMAGLTAPCISSAQAEPIIARIHRICAGIGLEPGNFDFYVCTQTLAGSAGIPPYLAAARDPIDASLHAYGDFYHRDWHLSEQHACASLGLSPGSQPFQQCVANLDLGLNAGQNLPLTR
ncbi:MAG TPA: hypothetical protein VL492_05915 [Methylovirgula sp.]|jgi:hypothetical protein|nr:hypothetical protein [Methylovirgula sp.]